MCLILIGWKTHPQYPLVVAANRDEFLNRPTAPADFWQDHPQVLAGRDLQAGGTWMGITKTLRFAALTNYRDPDHLQPNGFSRGNLVSNFLIGDQSPREYIESIYKDSERYNGFNLLLGNGEELHWLSNITGESKSLEPGVYGISNHLLDTPWPKLIEAKQAFQESLKSLPDTSEMSKLLSNDQIHPDEILPNTGVSLDRERALSAIFVTTFPGYGTRGSTVLTADVQGTVNFTEKTWLEGGVAGQTSSFKFNSKD
jgi:uncharacterized protein with NRDE domain